MLYLIYDIRLGSDGLNHLGEQLNTEVQIFSKMLSSQDYIEEAKDNIVQKAFQMHINPMCL
jgi:hypothetical protein